jgi:RNA polymerase sigma-70 factor, ECF subfamily
MADHRKGLVSNALRNTPRGTQSEYMHGRAAQIVAEDTKASKRGNVNRTAQLDPTQGGHEGAPPRSSATTSAVLTERQGDASEAELIQRILGGDSEAFRELVRPYEHAVFMTAQAILKNEADAEDAAQEAVLKAFSNLAKFRGDSKFSTWLIRIVTNEAFMKVRKNRRHKVLDSFDEQRKNEEGDYIPRDFADWHDIPSEALRKKELRQALSRALASLTPKHREVFVLRDVQHFTIEETAQLLGIRESAVKTRLLRARLQMRDSLAPGIDGSWSTGRSEYKQVRPW